MFITKNLQGVEEGNLSATLTPSWTAGMRDRLYELSCNLAPLNQLLGVVLWKCHRSDKNTARRSGSKDFIIGETGLSERTHIETDWQATGGSVEYGSSYRCRDVRRTVIISHGSYRL